MNCFLPYSGFAPTTKAATVLFTNKLQHIQVVVLLLRSWDWVSYVFAAMHFSRLKLSIIHSKNSPNNVFARILLNIHVMDDFIQMSYLYDVFLRSTAKLPATSRQPEVTYTSCAKLTLLRYSSGLEPGDSSPVYIRP